MLLSSLALLAVVVASGAAWDGPHELAPLPNQQDEKEARTPAQRKINSQILFEIYRRRGEADRKAVPPGPTDVRIDKAGRALVDVRAAVTRAILKEIRDLGGVVLSTSSRDHSIVARIPILKLERLAGDATVRAIEPAAEAITNRPKR